MKLLLIICAIILVLQFAVLGYSFTDGGDAPTDEEIEDGDWDAGEEFPMTKWANGVLAPFRPRAKILNDGLDQALAGDEERIVEYRHDIDKKRVIIELSLASGDGALVKYRCGVLNRKGFTCPEQVICLCPEGRAINLNDFDGCGKARPDGPICEEEGNTGEIIVYSKRGEFLVRGLGDEGAALRAN